MRRWRGPVGLAEQYGKKLHVVFANPFEFFDSVYSTLEQTVAKEKLVDAKNISFHRSAEHPLVARSAPYVVPGWNTVNDEVSATGEYGVYMLFDRKGRLAFRGRATIEEIEERVKKLVRGR